MGLENRKSKEDEKVLLKNGIEWCEAFGYIKNYEGTIGASVSCENKEIMNILNKQ